MTDKPENQDWGDEMDRSEHEQTYDAFSPIPSIQLWC